MTKTILAAVIAIGACGGAKPPAPPAPTAGTGAPATDDGAGGTATRRIFDFSGEALDPDAAEPAAAAPEAVAKKSILGELRRHYGAIAACVAKDATAKGEIVLVFGIAAAGGIGDVYVNGPGTDETHACVTGVVKTFAFAPDAGGVSSEVHFPLTIK